LYWKGETPGMTVETPRHSPLLAMWRVEASRARSSGAVWGPTHPSSSDSVASNTVLFLYLYI